MEEINLKIHAEKLKDENKLSSVAIICTKGIHTSSYRLGSPHEMLMSTLSGFKTTLEEINPEEDIKNGAMTDEEGVWSKLLEINNLIKQLGIR